MGISESELKQAHMDAKKLLNKVKDLQIILNKK